MTLSLDKHDFGQGPVEMHTVLTFLRVQPDPSGWFDVRDFVYRRIECAADVNDFRAQGPDMDMSVALGAEEVTVLRQAPPAGIQFLSPLDGPGPEFHA